MSRPKCPTCQADCMWREGYNCCDDENCHANSYPEWVCSECFEYVPGGNPYVESEAGNE